MDKQWKQLVSNMRRASAYRPNIAGLNIRRPSNRRESRRLSRRESGASNDRRETLMDLWTLIKLRGNTSEASALDGMNATDAKNEVDAFLSHEEDEDAQPLTREGILEKIRQKKEVIEKLRCQPWSMKRKRKTLRLAQKHLEKHESKVSRTHLYREGIDKRWKKFKRWIANISIYLIPWEAKIKRIESHYGSVVSSYFTFLRWIFWVNFMITLIVTFFIVIPECLADVGADEKRFNETHSRKHLSGDERNGADVLQTLWDFKGYLRVTPMFYGFYGADESMGKTIKYHLPLAYLLVNLFILGYSFFAILRKMAANARQSKLASGKTEQYIFCWKVYTGWDYTIGNSETASNTVMSNVNKMREAIAEYRVKLRQKFVCLRFLLRIVANIIILAMIVGSTFVIQEVVRRSQDIGTDAGAFRQNEVPIVVSFITLIFPNLFELVGGMERYHPRTSLRAQLGRVLVLYVLNYYTLCIALMDKMKYVTTHDTQDNRTSMEFLTTETPNFRYARNIDWINLTNLEKSVIQPPNVDRFPNNASQQKSNEKRHSRKLRKKLRGSRMYQENSIPNLTTTGMHARTTHPSNTVHNYSIDDQDSTFPIQSDDANQIVPIEDATTSRPEKFFEKIKQKTTLSSILRVPAKTPPKRLAENRPRPTQIKRTPNMGDTKNLTPNLKNISIERVEAKLVKDNRTKAEREKEQRIQTIQKFKSHAQPQTQNRDHICWENMIGQEIAKLIMTDLVMNIASILAVDFFRALWVRYCNTWWCWNLETTFPEYGEFKVAENVLHIINNQGMIWLGLFFAPLLPALNNVKLIVLLYVRAWAVMTCNVPAQQIFRASRSSNFYLVLLLLMLFMCTLPVGYVIAAQHPSKQCGPFAGMDKFYQVITKKLKPAVLEKLQYVASPGVVIPILVLLVLVIYFLVSLIRGMREANDDLQKQLFHERTEEKRKIYQLAGGGRKETDAGPVLPENKQIDLSHLPAEEQRRRESWRPRIPLGTASESRLGNNLISVQEENDDRSTPSISPGMDMLMTRRITTANSVLSTPKTEHHYYDAIPASDGEFLVVDSTTDVAESTEGEDGDRRTLIKQRGKGKERKKTTVVNPQLLRNQPDIEVHPSDSSRPWASENEPQTEDTDLETSDPASPRTVVTTPEGIREMLSNAPERVPEAQFPSPSDTIFNHLVQPDSDRTRSDSIFSSKTDYDNWKPDGLSPGSSRIPPGSPSDEFSISPRELEHLISPISSDSVTFFEPSSPPTKGRTVLDPIDEKKQRGLFPKMKRPRSGRKLDFASLPPPNKSVTPEQLLVLTRSPKSGRRSKFAPSPKGSPKLSGRAATTEPGSSQPSTSRVSVPPDFASFPRGLSASRERSPTHFACQDDPWRGTEEELARLARRRGKNNPLTPAELILEQQAIEAERERPAVMAWSRASRERSATKPPSGDLPSSTSRPLNPVPAQKKSVAIMDSFDPSIPSTSSTVVSSSASQEPVNPSSAAPLEDRRPQFKISVSPSRKDRGHSKSPGRRKFVIRKAKASDVSSGEESGNRTDRSSRSALSPIPPFVHRDNQQSHHSTSVPTSGNTTEDEPVPSSYDDSIV